MTEAGRADEGARRRRWVVVAGALALVLAVIGVVWATNQAQSPGPVGPPPPTGSTSAPTSSPTETQSPSAPPPSVPTPTASGTPTVVPSQELPVEEAPLDEPVEVGAGVVVRVDRIESVTGTAQGPGEVAGPALRTTVTLENRTDQTVPLTSAIVNLYYGPDRAPANELSGPGVSLLGGDLAPGRTATGVNVFAVPTDARSSVVVEVLLSADVPIIQFEGAP